MITLAITLIALAITTQPAHAAATRAEYVAQVDPICQQAGSTQKAVIRSGTKTVKALERRGFDAEQPSKPIGRVIIRAYDRLAAVQRAADSQIGAVAPAPGDEATTASWLEKRAAFTELFQRAGHLFAHRKRTKSVRLFMLALHAEEDAATLVGEFGFASCTQIVPGF